MKVIPTPLALLLCLSTTYTMSLDSTDSEITATSPESACAIETISIDQALHESTLHLSDQEHKKLNQQLLLYADNNNLIASATAHAIVQQFAQEQQNTKKITKIIKEMYIWCNFGLLDRAESLLKQNLPFNALDETFINIHSHLHSPQNQLHAMRLLLRYGANPNTINQSGNNLLHNLLYTEYPHTNTIIEELVLAGLSIEHKNNDGFSVLDLVAHYQTKKTQQAEQSNSISRMTLRTYYRTISVILHALQHKQTIRQSTYTALDNQLPNTLKNLICEYANVADRDKEIDFTKKHWQQTKWKLLYNHYTFLKQQLTHLFHDLFPSKCDKGMLISCMLFGLCTLNKSRLPATLIQNINNGFLLTFTGMASILSLWEILGQQSPSNLPSLQSKILTSGIAGSLYLALMMTWSLRNEP